MYFVYSCILYIYNYINLFQRWSCTGSDAGPGRDDVALRGQVHRGLGGRHQARLWSVSLPQREQVQGPVRQWSEGGERWVLATGLDCVCLRRDTASSGGRRAPAGETSTSASSCRTRDTERDPTTSLTETSSQGAGGQANSTGLDIKLFPTGTSWTAAGTTARDTESSSSSSQTGPGTRRSSSGERGGGPGTR